MSDDHRAPLPLTRRHLLQGTAVALGTALLPTPLVAAAMIPASPAARSALGANCARTSVGLTPLPDLGTGTYRGFVGGLYPDGATQPPAAYAQEGLAHPTQVQLRDAAGQPDPNGHVALLSIGMSNATQEFATFQQMADADRRKNAQLTIVDGAQGGQDAEEIKNPHGRYWSVVDQRLQRAGVTAAQVQAIWLQEAIIRPDEPFPADAQRLQADLAAIVTVLTGRFPHLQLIYLASRTYGGYASTPENPEPYAYESGFAVQWLIADRIRGGDGPWLGWGPYLWTDGIMGRRDGFVWTCADVRSTDGMHPSASGCQKVAQLLLSFFTTDLTAQRWFTRA